MNHLPKWKQFVLRLIKVQFDSPEVIKENQERLYAVLTNDYRISREALERQSEEKYKELEQSVYWTMDRVGLLLDTLGDIVTIDLQKTGSAPSIALDYRSGTSSPTPWQEAGSSDSDTISVSLRNKTVPEALRTILFEAYKNKYGQYPVTN